MTDKQRETFDFIVTYTDDHGCAPNYFEMAAAQGVTPGAIATRVSMLIRLGYLGRSERYVERGLRVLRYPGRVSA